MLRRTKTVYAAVDSFLSPRGRVLHHFDQLLDELGSAQIPCIWMTGGTRAQLDEPRRRFGQHDPYIGENGCGVYLPEDYFHLKGSKTVRLGRYTCIPMAKPHPAAAEALDELAAELEISVVPLRKLSLRELSQNTGLPPKEAELVRMRDFDELFFFAGATEAEISRFQDQAKARELVLQPAGAFWSLSCGADLAKCVKELGGLYDRALRSHAIRVGLRMGVPENAVENPDVGQRWPKAAFDRTVTILERLEKDADLTTYASGKQPAEDSGGRKFYIGSPTVWEEVLDTLSLSSPSLATRKPQLR
jgi:predicted mannosyl-3-phosphoglycerate phosphatase (HAD superfamily)